MPFLCNIIIFSLSLSMCCHSRFLRDCSPLSPFTQQLFLGDFSIGKKWMHKYTRKICSNKAVGMRKNFLRDKQRQVLRFVTVCVALLMKRSLEENKMTKKLCFERRKWNLLLKFYAKDLWRDRTIILIILLN